MAHVIRNMILTANATLTSPGVIIHNYTNTPLKPQIEVWRVLSWPHPDWLLAIYCGFNPALRYDGGLLLHRSDAPPIGALPASVEKEFRSTAKKFSFDYDSMCISDVSKC